MTNQPGRLCWGPQWFCQHVGRPGLRECPGLLLVAIPFPTAHPPIAGQPCAAHRARTQQANRAATEGHASPRGSLCSFGARHSAERLPAQAATPASSAWRWPLPAPCPCQARCPHPRSHRPGQNMAGSGPRLPALALQVATCPAEQGNPTRASPSARTGGTGTAHPRRPLTGRHQPRARGCGTAARVRSGRAAAEPPPPPFPGEQPKPAAGRRGGGPGAAAGRGGIGAAAPRGRQGETETAGGEWAIPAIAARGRQRSDGAGPGGGAGPGRGGALGPGAPGGGSRAGGPGRGSRRRRPRGRASVRVFAGTGPAFCRSSLIRLAPLTSLN